MSWESARNVNANETMRSMSTKSASPNIGRRHSTVVLAVTLLLTLQMTPRGSAVSVPARQQTSAGAASDVEESDVDDAVALEQLTRVFGVGRVPDYYDQRRQNFDDGGEDRRPSARHRVYRRSPPEYMVDLYDTIAYTDGISKTAAPYEADIVLGIPDKGRH